MPTSNLLCSASSFFCAELARRLRGLHGLGGVLRLNGGVGHVGRDLQLDLLQLRLHLIELHARACDVGLLRAQAERIAEVQLHRPARVAVAEQRS